MNRVECRARAMGTIASGGVNQVPSGQWRAVAKVVVLLQVLGFIGLLWWCSLKWGNHVRMFMRVRVTHTGQAWLVATPPAGGQGISWYAKGRH